MSTRTARRSMFAGALVSLAVVAASFLLVAPEAAAEEELQCNVGGNCMIYYGTGWLSGICGFPHDGQDCTCWAVSPETGGWIWVPNATCRRW